MSAAVVLGCSAVVAPAGAVWGGARIVDHYIQAAAGNAQGVQAFAWDVGTSESVMLGRSPYGVSFPRARLRLLDGSLTRPQALTRRHAIVASVAAVGLDGRGAATALWSETGIRSLRLMASVRPPGGSFARGTEIGRVGSSRVGYNQVLSVAPDGAAVVLWSSGEHVYAAQRPPGRCVRGAPRACFGRPQRLAGGRCPRGIADCLNNPELVVAVAPGGRAFAAWTAVKRTSDGFRIFVRLAVARPGHRFDRPIAVSDAADTATGARIAIVRDGAIVTWVTGTTRRRHRVVAMRVGPDGQRRSPPTVLSQAPCLAAMTRVNALDEVTIAWTCAQDPDLDQITIAAFAGPAAGRLAPGVDLGRRAYASQDALAVDANDNTLLLYSPDGTATVTRVRPPGGAFGPPLALPALPGRQQPVESGGRLIEAGPRLTLLQTGEGPTSILRDWTP